MPDCQSLEMAQGCGCLGGILRLLGLAGEADLAVKPAADLTPYERNKQQFYQRHEQEQQSGTAPCPSCRKQMRCSQWENVELHDCDKCRGLWVNEDRLTDLFRAEPPESLINPKVKRISFYKSPSGSRKCPKCRQLLMVKPLDSVVVERCAACQGAWLDHGEFHTLRALWLKDYDPATDVDPLCRYCDLTNSPERRRCQACGAPLPPRK